MKPRRAIHRRHKAPPPPPKRRLYADFRHLVFLEGAARQLKLPPIQRGPAQIAELAASKPHGFALDPGAEAPAPTSRSVVLVVDQRINMFYGSKRKTKSVVAVEAAALIAWRALTQEYRVGALVFNDTRIVPFTPNCSRLEVMIILHTLLNQNHLLSQRLDRRSNSGMLNAALQRAEKLSTGGSLVVLITDASGYDQETQRVLEAISKRDNLVVAVVYDPRQLSFRKTGSFIAEDHMADLEDLTGAHFVANGISITSLSTRDDTTVQLRRVFRKSSWSHGLRMDQSGASRTSESKNNEQSHGSATAHQMEFKGALFRPRNFSPGKQLSLCESSNSQ